MIAIPAKCKALYKMSQTILITAGATREHLDPVRFIGNRSSGHLGCQLALAAAIHGHNTTLLLSKASETPTTHPRLQTHRFTTTRDLDSLMHQHWPSHSILIMAAAVADFTPKGGCHNEKIGRANALSLALVPTVDLVATAAKNARDDQRIIAFALCDESTLEEVAMEKLERKGVDAIIANPLQTMDSENISATLYSKDGNFWSPPTDCSKTTFAHWLIENITTFLAS